MFKNKQGLIMVFLVLIVVLGIKIADVYAEEGILKDLPVEISADIALNSKYIWRGFVKLERDKLYVRLRRFKNPLIDYAARSLCEELNKMGTVTLDKFCFPVHYEVA